MTCGRRYVKAEVLKMSTRRIDYSAMCNALQVCELAFCSEIKFTSNSEQENIKHLRKLKLLEENRKSQETVAKCTQASILNFSTCCYSK